MNIEDRSQHDLTGRRIKQVLVLFAIVAGFFLLAEHRAHLLPYLPWLFLAACPLMHMFMHHGHGSHHHAPNAEPEERPGKAKDAPHVSSKETRHSTGSDTSRSLHRGDHD